MAKKIDSNLKLSRVATNFLVFILVLVLFTISLIAIIQNVLNL
jgi:hypothetical protein